MPYCCRLNNNLSKALTRRNTKWQVAFPASRKLHQGHRAQLHKTTRTASKYRNGKTSSGNRGGIAKQKTSDSWNRCTVQHKYAAVSAERLSLIGIRPYRRSSGEHLDDQLFSALLAICPPLLPLTTATDQIVTNPKYTPSIIVGYGLFSGDIAE